MKKESLELSGMELKNKMLEMKSELQNWLKDTNNIKKLNFVGVLGYETCIGVGDEWRTHTYLPMKEIWGLMVPAGIHYIFLNNNKTVSGLWGEIKLNEAQIGALNVILYTPMYGDAKKYKDCPDLIVNNKSVSGRYILKGQTAIDAVFKI